MLRFFRWYVTNPTGTSNGGVAPRPKEAALGFLLSASLNPGLLSALWCLCATVDLTAEITSP